MAEREKRTIYGRQIMVIRKNPKYPSYMTGAVYDVICSNCLNETNCTDIDIPCIKKNN